MLVDTMQYLQPPTSVNTPCSCDMVSDVSWRHACMCRAACQAARLRIMRDECAAVSSVEDCPPDIHTYKPLLSSRQGYYPSPGRDDAICFPKSMQSMMSMVVAACWLLMLACLTRELLALGNGLALTPPMGYNTWNYYGCSSEFKCCHSVRKHLLHSQLISCDTCNSSQRLPSTASCACGHGRCIPFCVNVTVYMYESKCLPSEQL